MTCGSQEGYPRDSDFQREGKIRKPWQSSCQIFESSGGSRFLYYRCEDLNGIFLKDFSSLSVSCFAVLFHKPLATQSAVLAAQILALASHCTCVLLFLHPVINVLGLYGIPSIQISHFLSVSVPFLCMCVVVGMLSNKVCLHLISTLTN